MELPPDDAKVAFRIAAQCNNVPVLHGLMRLCAGTRYHRGRPAITYAICEGHAEAVEALLPHEAGLLDDDGWSSLRLACAVGLPAIVELLAADNAELATLDLARSPADYCQNEACRALLAAAWSHVANSV
eukprot:gnl/Ergobibamus_cyprinoides/1116.p2 GENE.gnl/Ergobibamus_cyprinoides/1116~~gnl/Ergobibamus_cyprinoides/1116.p2  ORF type:complete len:130 (-),score=33.51 gnl/Ergobibamus_cyprinoides/1116:18-407(-)